MTSVLTPEEIETLRIVNLVAALQAQNAELRKQVDDLRHPLLDQEDSQARARISKSGSLSLTADAQFLRQLPGALWKLIPQPLKGKVFVIVCTALLSLAHSGATLYRIAHEWVLVHVR